MEFKFFRSGYEGSKYPILSIKQDIEKLKNLESFYIDNGTRTLKFVEKIMSIIFIGDKNKKIIDAIKQDSYFIQNKGLFRVID